MIQLMRMIGILSLVVLAGALLMVVLGSFQFNPKKLVPAETGGFGAPVMAMEFVETTRQVAAILDKNNSQNRGAMRTQIYIDFVWILSYWLLFLAISYLLSDRNCPWAFYLAAVAAVSASGAAAFDVWENLGMLSVVNNAAITQEQLSALHIRDAAVVKWTLVFVSMAILATAFYGLHEKLTRIGFFFTLTALVGFISLFYKPLLGILVPLPLLIGLVILAFTSLRSPKLFYEERFA
ncbi:MAG TPA: hypothetical protein VJU86_17710 [Pyrinomonadaceae bacterium]|nr:hypothetical protein [Pyrinomonadaceae bacterium]